MNNIDIVLLHTWFSYSCTLFVYSIPNSKTEWSKIMNYGQGGEGCRGWLHRLCFRVALWPCPVTTLQPLHLQLALKLDTSGSPCLNTKTEGNEGNMSRRTHGLHQHDLRFKTVLLKARATHSRHSWFLFAQ